MNDTMLPDPKERRIAELENQLAQAHATIEALQKQLRQLLGPQTWKHAWML